MSEFLSAWTVVAALIFAAVTAWALSSSRKSDFDAAARIPLDDELDKNEKTEA
jgi:cbb3-type cytochrome oxidase subunit 3